MQFILNKKQIQPYLYLLPVLRELNDKNINLSNEVFYCLYFGDSQHTKLIRNIFHIM